MRFKIVFILAATLALLSKCKNPRDNYKVAESLIQDNPYKIFYAAIQSKGGNFPAIQAKANTVYSATENILHFMDSLKTELHHRDSTGESMSPSTALLVHTPASDSLRQMLIILSTYDSSLRVPEPIRSDANWSEEYFKKTPTVGAITILNKFESDCKKATEFTLANLFKQLAHPNPVPLPTPTPPSASKPD
jgi:hypothetical protein